MAKRLYTDSTSSKLADLKQSADMEDDSHNFIKCSNCNCPLIDVWITQPSVPYYFSVIAECAYCGDKSYEKRFKGAFHLGFTEYTKIKNCISESDMKQNEDGNFMQGIIVQTVKGEKQWE